MELIERVEQLESELKALRPELHFPSTATVEHRLRWLEIVLEEIRARGNHGVYAETPSEEKLRQLLAHTVYIKPDRITLHSLTADPGSVVAGDEWYRNDLGKVKLAVDAVVANAKLLRREGDTVPATDIASLDATKITTGRFPMARLPDGTSGQVLTAQGAGVDPAYAAAAAAGGLAIFGDGSDGDVTISSNTTLTRDMFYNSLTVNAGITLNTGGYRIFVKGTLTNNGIITNPGGNGGNATSSAVGAAGAAGASGSIGGGGAGAIGTATADASNFSGGGGGGGGVVLIVARYIVNNGTISANGGNAGTGYAAIGTLSTYTQYGYQGGIKTNSFGGPGGASGATTSPFSVSGGAASTVTLPAASETGYRSVPFAVILRLMSSPGTLIGGGAGGGSGATCVSLSAGAAGGGGGGGGGLIILIGQIQTTGTITVTGGTHSNAVTVGGSAANGADGSTGTIIEISN